MTRTLFIVLIFCIGHHIHAQGQGSGRILIKIQNEQKNAIPGVRLYLMANDSTLIQSAYTNTSGIYEFIGLKPAKYLLKASLKDFEDGFSQIDLLNLNGFNGVSTFITLKAKSILLNEVTILSKKPAIQFLADKTVINPEANITNAGATVMDILEKAPGITVNKDGTIIMKGKPAVMVLIDGKPTQLSGADLQSYLSGMSATQVDVVELIESPGAKYDAAGNAGIINIRTKANRLKGFNGSVNLSIGQGFYPKTGNSLNLNYRNGKWNWFMNYGNRASYEKQNIYTLRKYFDKNQQDSALLEQPNFSKTSQAGNNIKTGLDWFANKNTTMGLVFTGGLFDRNADSYSAIKWMDRFYHLDSTINTSGENNRHYKRGGINLNARHKIDSRSEWSADLDYVKFNINGDQNYQTQLDVPGSTISATKGNIPSRLNIFTARFDYSKQFKNILVESGLKSAFSKTDNLSEYYYLDNNSWQADLSRSNHFLYNEKITAAYSSLDGKKGKWHWQGGLRFEFTSYKAHQLGNALVKDSAFKKNYGGLFPSGFLSFDADSNNSFTFKFGRRIDRPPFQNLNPFLTTLNKYTFEGGNPFINPQYTWNLEVAHIYRQLLTSEFGYSYLSDYFSQIFIIDSNSSNVNKNIIIYTRGNVGSFQNFTICETFQRPVTKWWNLTAVALFNHKIIKGVVWAPLTAKVTQLNVSLNNQFQFKKGWGVEISGYYQTRSQIDLQEWLKPQGELNLGVSKQIMKNKGSLKLSVRDITYFTNYSGYSTFQNAYEPFTIKWDSRVVRLNFNWRFGKAMKTVNRSEGGAKDEIDRVGNGN